MDAIIDALEKQRNILGMNDQRFADHLGISRGLWLQTRNKTTPVGMTLLKAALQTFPGLRDEALAAIAAYAPVKEARQQAVAV